MTKVIGNISLLFLLYFAFGGCSIFNKEIEDIGIQYVFDNKIDSLSYDLLSADCVIDTIPYYLDSIVINYSIEGLNYLQHSYTNNYLDPNERRKADVSRANFDAIVTKVRDRVKAIHEKTNSEYDIALLSFQYSKEILLVEPINWLKEFIVVIDRNQKIVIGCYEINNETKEYLETAITIAQGDEYNRLFRFRKRYVQTEIEKFIFGDK